MKPKSYLALDWDDINELEKTAKELFDADTNDVDWLRGSVILYVIDWMRQNNIYTRPFKTETNDRTRNDR
jgi:hypothetical protein